MMRRLPKLALTPLLPRLLTIRTFGGGGVPFQHPSAESQGLRDGKNSANMADPLLYSAPSTCGRVIGRDKDVVSLWQNLLTGKRLQVICGIDGVGKSSIATEFCECAKKSNRFSCIHWFDSASGYSLDDQLNQFIVRMQGRREKDVLLVFDDVADPDALVAKLPTHPHVFVLMTTSKQVDSCAKYHAAKAQPLSDKASNELCQHLHGFHEGVLELCNAVGNVPILIHLATKLVQNEVLSADEIAARLKHGSGDVLSVSSALQLLLEIALGQLLQEYPLARKILGAAACLHLNDISSSVFDSLCREAGAGSDSDGSCYERFGERCSELGITTHKWDADCFAMHPLVAKGLRQMSPRAVDVACSAVSGLWPRRWRNMGTDAAMSLVWHVVAIRRVFEEQSQPLPPALLTAMDKAATYCAHAEGCELRLAASLWLTILESMETLGSGATLSEMGRVAHECGKTLHFLGDPTADNVLAKASTYTAAAFGAASFECALVLVVQCPYLADDETTLKQLRCGINAIRQALISTDAVMSKEEARQAEEGLFVLLGRQIQVMQAMGEPEENTAAVWREMKAIGSKLQPPAKR